jgi:hypothetical protein
VNWPLMIAFAFGLAAGHYWRASRSLRIETFRLRDSLDGYVLENKKLNADVKALHAVLQLPPPLETKDAGIRVRVEDRDAQGNVIFHRTVVVNRDQK